MKRVSSSSRPALRHIHPPPQQHKSSLRGILGTGVCGQIHPPIQQREEILPSLVSRLLYYSSSDESVEATLWQQPKEHHDDSSIASPVVDAAIEIVADAILNNTNNNNNTMASSTIGITSPAAGGTAVDHGPVITMIVQYLLGTSYMTAEWQALTMAIQGCMIVRNTLNKDGQTLQWFHALVLSILYGFAGGLLGFVWLGKPSSLLSAGDVNLGACLIAFVIVNYSPFDIGYKLLQTWPLTIFYTSGAQLFRTTGIIRFVSACYGEFKHAPSPYYPIPVLGPILYGTLLGNMSGFLFKGVEGHVRNGVPWPMQNGLFCATLYHFIVHDTTGIIGTTLRHYCYPTVLRELLKWDDKIFAGLFVSIFMQVTGLLQLPHFYGPTFSPFEITGRVLYSAVVIPMTGGVGGGSMKKTTTLDKVDDATTTTTTTTTGNKKHNNNTNHHHHNNNNKSKNNNKKKEL